MKAIVSKGIPMSISPEEKDLLQQVNGVLVLYPLEFFQDSLEELRHAVTDKVFQ